MHFVFFVHFVVASSSVNTQPHQRTLSLISETLSLEQPPDEITDVVAYDRNAETDDEHVEPGPENAPAGEHGAGSPYQEMREHRDAEGNQNRQPSAREKERKDGDYRAERGCQTSHPSLAKR